MKSDEVDARVAEMVMGWQQHRVMDDCWATGPVDNRGLEPFRQKHYFKPTTDVADDYEVLKRVRETWDKAKLAAMHEAMMRIWGERFSKNLPPGSWGPANQLKLWALYIPGDYSRAALLALGVDVGGGE